MRLAGRGSGQLSVRSRRALADGANARSTPLLLVPPALIGYLFLLVPSLGLLIRAPWSSLRTIFGQSDVGAALRLSLATASITTLVSLVVGVPLAWLLARSRVPGLAVLRTIVTLPLVLPPIVGGVALLLTFGRNGYLGRFLYDWTGYSIPFTRVGVVVSQTFVAMPFLVVTVEGAFRSADRRLEEAAATLGARRASVFARVTLPVIAPSLAAGAVLCWARALGEFGATILFNGSYQGVTQTMPALIYQQFDEAPENAVALSLVLMLVAVIILGALRDKWLRPAPST